MDRKFMAMALSLILVGAFACKKKEQPVPQAPVPAPGIESPMPPAQEMPATPGIGLPMPPGQGMPASPGQEIAMPKGGLQIVVPPNVKGKWSAVKIIVEDKVAKKTHEYTVNLNSDFTIPDSNLKVTIGEFLPDLKMDGLTLTSISNEPNNPAVGIKVFEDGKQIFPAPGKQWGWLFAKLPAIHPFEHPRYGLKLKEGIAKKG